MNIENKQILIWWAWPVWLASAILLASKWAQVKVLEKRRDPEQWFKWWRSVNIALSAQWMRTLNEIWILDEVMLHAIPMEKRTTHDVTWKLDDFMYWWWPIYSISRATIVQILSRKAQSLWVDVEYNCRITTIDKMNDSVIYQDLVSLNEGKSEDKTYKTSAYDILIWADWLNSTIRSIISWEKAERVPYQYKEFTIDANDNSRHKIDKNSLHIRWRDSCMLIALPNTDWTFTCTLFAPDSWDSSFDKIFNNNNIDASFKELFPDAYKLIWKENLQIQTEKNWVSDLLHIKTDQRSDGNIMLLWDAAHAVLPFYGLWMNTWLADVLQYIEALEEAKDDSYAVIHQRFQNKRKKDTDIIYEKSFDNFEDMRTTGEFEWTAVEKSLKDLDRKLQLILEQQFPNQYRTEHNRLSNTYVRPFDVENTILIKQSDLNKRILTTWIFENMFTWKEISKELLSPFVRDYVNSYAPKERETFFH